MSYLNDVPYEGECNQEGYPLKPGHSHFPSTDLEVDCLARKAVDKWERLTLQENDNMSMARLAYMAYRETLNTDGKVLPEFEHISLREQLAFLAAVYAVYIHEF